MNDSKPPEPATLPRVLGAWMATAIVIGTVIGSGVFKKPEAVAHSLSTFTDESEKTILVDAHFGLIIIAWVVVGLLSFLGSLVLAEVAIVHPKAGGNYVFLREGYGRWAGFLWGWVEFWIIRAGSIAALASVFAQAFHGVLRYALNSAGNNVPVLEPWAEQGVTVTVIVVLAIVNALGTKLGGGVQLIVTTVKVGSLLSIALLPFIYLAFASDPSAVSLDRLQPIWPESVRDISLSGFGGAMVAGIWAYHGWMNLAPMAGEVKNPNRNLPLAFMMGTLAIIVLYVSVNVAYHLVVPRGEMVFQGTTTPVATIFSERLLGPVGLLLASLALLISVFGALNGNLLVGPRLLVAMAADGLAPRALNRLHAKWGTPFSAIAVLTGWSVLLVLGASLLNYIRPMEKELFNMLTDYAMFGAVSFETLAVASIFMVRRQYPVGTVELPYRCWGYPFVPIVYILAMTAVLGNMFYTQTIESLIAVVFIGIGAAVYYFVFGGKTLAV